jgi:ATP-dependent RNA helicase DHX29
LCTTIQSTEEDRRANFVDKLLEEDSFSLTTSSSSFENSLPLVDSYVKDKDDLGVVKSNNRAKRDSYIEAECLSLQRKQENKKRTQKYKVEYAYV